MIQKWAIATSVVVVLLLTGCGSGVGSADSQARTTCRAQGLSDDLIDYFYTLARADRDAGFSLQQELSIVRPSCRDGDASGGGCVNNPNISPVFTIDQCVLQCSVCVTAILDDVFP